jgi:electron transfer flavoprotein beta subunit
MNILVPMKQIVDADQFARLRLGAGGESLDRTGLDLRTNPFDECALEAALRLTEDGRARGQRLGEVVTTTLGPVADEPMLRSTLAIGAQRAIRVDTLDAEIDGRLTSHVIATLAAKSNFMLVLLGRQSADGDGNEVAQRVAALLDWPHVTCATSILEQPDESVHVQRELDLGGVLCVELHLPAVVSVDLRITQPSAVRSRCSPSDYSYADGVRFASLPAILAAQRKPLQTKPLAEFVGNEGPVLRHVAFEMATPRAHCQMVGSCAELLQALPAEIGAV